ncbi:acetylglutamate kinase [Cytobacillus sp. FJAT-54145]|uniref:Acetylglutamate kinase n=1 Tax=Cytobacillus spartinae TaxID=3299023 RepID=A0ABW6KCB0_9BACI
MKKIVIKCGGSILDELSSEFFQSLTELKKLGYQIVIVHGGGPDINDMLNQLNVVPEFDNGLRKTDKKTFKVVEMVLSGKTNRKLVEKLTTNGLGAIGVNGSDANILLGNFVNREKLGFVGSVDEVNTELLYMFLEKGLVPVITPIACTTNGTKLNVNADYAAAAVAHALRVDHCLFVTDVEGIKINGKFVKSLQLEELEGYIRTGEIYGGMIPKVNSAVSAIEKGIDSVMIVSGLTSFFHHHEWHGTKIYGKERVAQ